MQITTIGLDIAKHRGGHEATESSLPAVRRSSCRVRRVRSASNPRCRFRSKTRRRPKVSLEFLDVRALSDLSEAFDTAAQRGVDGVLILDSPLFLTILKTVAELAVQYKLPSLYWLPEFAAPEV